MGHGFDVSDLEPWVALESSPSFPWRANGGVHPSRFVGQFPIRLYNPLEMWNLLGLQTQKKPQKKST